MLKQREKQDAGGCGARVAELKAGGADAGGCGAQVTKMKAGGAPCRVECIGKESCWYSGLRDLWCEVFGDEPAYVDAFYDNWGDDIRGYVAVEGGEVASALTVFVLGDFEGSSLRTIYAVCTSPKHRGRGLGSMLTSYAKDAIISEGAVPVLSPAEPSLINFYEPLGFQSTFTSARIDSSEFKAGEDGYVEISPEEYWELREKLLPDIPHVVPGECTRRWVEKDYGTFLARFQDDGIAAGICVPGNEVLPECAAGGDYVQGMSAGLGQPCKKAYLGFAFE